MIHSVRKAVSILRLFTAKEPRLTLSEISRRLEMPKSTTHNLLNTLLIDGFIEKVDGDHYALGTAPLELTQSVRVNVEVRDPAAPLLRKLADDTSESVYLTILHGDYALYIYAVESPRRLAARTAVGDLVHLHCTSVGKAMLAFLPPDRIEQFLVDREFPAFTATTITAVTALRQELATIAEQGFAIDRAEHEPQTYCLGAPIFNAQGEVFGACSVSGAGVEVITERLPELSTALLSTAQQISRYMGFIPQRPSAIARNGRR